jgi:putative cardiolipin synthase
VRSSQLTIEQARKLRDQVARPLVTNSLEATDVPAVHIGYAKHRKKLLRSGVSIFEIQKMFGDAPVKRRGPAGSSNVSLHSKTFAIDRLRAFVGSFNFDPRSARLNTEMGFVIDSAVLAEAIADGFSNEIPIHAYRVRLSDVGRLQWVEQDAEKVIVHDQEPGASLLRRVGVSLLSLLPIEWLL